MRMLNLRKKLRATRKLLRYHTLRPAALQITGAGIPLPKNEILTPQPRPDIFMANLGPQDYCFGAKYFEQLGSPGIVLAVGVAMITLITSVLALIAVRLPLEPALCTSVVADLYSGGDF
jgi:hypothetical protein